MECKKCHNIIYSFNKHRTKCYSCKPKQIPDIVFWKHHSETGEPLYKKIWNWFSK